MLKKNIAANYAGQLYVAAAGLLAIPYYLKYLGPEAYGLVGLYAVLQVWMQILDVGLSPSMSREVSRYTGNPSSCQELLDVTKSLEIIFAIAAGSVGGGIFISRWWITEHWLTANSLDLALVAECVGLMGAAAALRWQAILYRSGINAFERQGWNNLADVLLTTVRIGGALFIIAVASNGVVVFFWFQLIVSIVELTVFKAKFEGLLPKPIGRKGRFNLGEMRRIAPFAFGTAYVTAVALSVSQTDKFLLSSQLTLREYGYYTLVVSIAGAVSILSGPIARAVLPRLTALIASNSHAEVTRIYLRSTQSVAVLIAPVTLMISYFPKEIMFIWTGNHDASSWAADVLPLFSIGNGILSLVSFQYYLQYAYGDLRMHIIYNSLCLIAFIPLLIFMTMRFGPLGAGSAWLVLQVITLVFWSPMVHRRFNPMIQREWFRRCVVAPYLTSFFILGMTAELVRHRLPPDRFLSLILLVGLGLLILLIAGGASIWIGKAFRSKQPVSSG